MRSALGLNPRSDNEYLHSYRYHTAFIASDLQQIRGFIASHPVRTIILFPSIRFQAEDIFTYPITFGTAQFSFRPILEG